MTHYSPQREAEQEQKEHFVNKTSTPEADKDLWQTPKALFVALNEEFDFKVDICASHSNAFLDEYFTEEYSALENEWDEYYGDSAFMNPPYSKTGEFLERAYDQARTYNITVVALVNANCDTKWFAEAASTANEIRLITGRVSFVSPATERKSCGNTRGQCLIIWRGKCNTPCQITMVDRKELEQ